MRIRVIAVGRDRRDPLCLAADDYIARLGRYVPAELVEVKEEPLKRSIPVARVQQIEAERIRKLLGSTDYLIALDERGLEQTSIELAARIDRFVQGGVQIVSVVVGGPSGLDPDLLREGRERWSLSRLTLPHRVARLVVAEQLYRAFTILRKEPYHK